MQIDKTSIAGKIPSFPVESQLSLGSRAKLTLQLNNTVCQGTLKKLNYEFNVFLCSTVII
jgi:hypothetical protein